MQSDFVDIAIGLAFELLKLSPYDPAIEALPVDAQESLAWLRRERELDAEREALRLQAGPRMYGFSIKIDRGVIERVGKAAEAQGIEYVIREATP